jgi:hypothetical protein
MVKITVRLCAFHECGKRFDPGTTNIQNFLPLKRLIKCDADVNHMVMEREEALLVKYRYQFWSACGEGGKCLRSAAYLCEQVCEMK